MTLIFICLFRYFSNFKNDDSVWDQNSIFYVSDYVTLANDEKENLQNSFTICSSIFVKVWVTRTTVIEMLKHDGSHWFNLELTLYQLKEPSTLYSCLELFVKCLAHYLIVGQI